MLFPPLLLLTTASSELAGFGLLPLAAALIGALLAVGALALPLGPWLGVDHAGLTSVFQGAIRTNTYVGLGAAGTLYGAAGLEVLGLVILIVVTTVNLLSVVALIHYGRRAAGGGELLASVARNPLILACLAGFALNAAGVDLAGVPRDTLAVLGQASLTLGLLCVGAGLELAHLGRNRAAALATCALKLAADAGRDRARLPPARHRGAERVGRGAVHRRADLGVLATCWRASSAATRR